MAEKYHSVEDVPPEVVGDVIEGIATLGPLLRRWRADASLWSLTGRWLDANGDAFEVTCDAEDRIWIKGSGEPVEVTVVVDG